MVRFFGETIVNEASSTDPTVPGGKIEAKDGGRIEILGGSVSNGSGAVFAATDHGSILFASTASNLLGVTNEDGGKITASDCGIITFKNVGLFNDTGATITAKDHGIVAFFETKNSTAGIMNGGTIRAEDHGVVAFVDVGVGESGGVMNAGGLIEAIGCGARVDLANSTIVGGTLQTRDGGVIDAVHGRSTFLNVFINGGIIAVDCHASLALLGDTIIDKTVTFEGPGVFLLKGSDSITGNGSSHALLKNDSTIAGSGTIGGNGLTLINECCGTILAIGGSGDPLIIDTGSHKITNDGLLEASWCGVLDIKSKLDNYGRVIATDGGEVVADANVVNKHGALIEAEHGGTVTLDGIKIENDFCAVIEAKGDCATVFIDCSTVDNAGTIEAKYGGTVSIADATIHNECGLIAAFGRGALVELTNSIIYGGTLATGDPCSPCFGAIEITGGANTVVFDGSGQKVTVDGFVQVDPGATLELIGTIDNKGTIDVDGESSADLQIDGTVKLDGRGDVVLDGRNDEITGAPTDDSHSAKLENSNEISGFGKIGSDSDGNLKLDNKADGVVNADMRHEKLVIETGNIVSNAGLLEASHGGILVIKDDVNNKGGAVDAHWFSTVVVGGITIDNTDGGANDGSVEAHGCGATVVLYDGTDIIGGALSTSDGGLIEIANQPGHTHSDVTFDGAERAADGSILPLIIDGVVRVDENTALTLKGTIKNDGIIDVDSEGHSSAGADLRIDGTVKLEGSGDVVLEGRNDEITGVPAGESRSAKLENSSEISGYGKIGSDGNGLLTLDNKADGVVDADMRHEKLVVDTGNTVTNEGLLEASCGGVLDIKDDVDNKGGIIGAYGAGSLVKLFGITVTGGTLETGDPYWRDDGLIEVMATCAMTVFDGSQQHDPVTIAGFVQVDPGAQLELKGTIDLDGGAIELDQATRHETVNGANLVIDGTVTLDGFGDVALEGNGTGIVGAWCGGGTLINDSYIYGSRGGFIGTGDDALTFINNNIVDSEAGHAGPLVIDTGCNIVTNTGTLEATGASELDLYGTYANQNGTIAASEDGSGPSVVKLFGATIEGGTLVTDGGSVAADGSAIEIVAGYGISVFDGSDQKVTVDAYVNVDSGAQLELIGTIQDLGIINVDEAASGADLVIDGMVKLNGGGEVLLSGSDDSIIGVCGDEDTSNMLVNSDTIAGYGKIGSDGNGLLTLDNKADGVVDADMRHEKLVVDTGNTVTNEGLLEARCGGVLDIKDDVDNKGGIIGAYGAGSLVKLFGITVTGGTLETGDPYWRDDGLIEVMATCAMTVFDGSQQHDPVTIAGFVQVDPGAQLELKGTIDLDGGAIELDQATRHETVNGANLVIDGTVTLDGFGDVALEGNGTGIVGAWCGGGTLINDSYIYGSRGGFIGTGDDALTFINNNIVDSEAGHAGPLVIDTGCNIVTNTGTLEATGASELDLYGTYANQNGTIAASEDGSGPSVVKLFGATIEGGTLVTDGGSVAADGSAIEIVAGYGISVFDGSDQKVTVDAYVNVDSGAQLELIGTIQDLGIINVDEAASGADLVIDGMVKLNGGGEILLSGSDDSIIGVCGDEDTSNMLVNSDTIAGYGKIGNAGSDESTDLTLTNKGMIDADVSGQTLTIHTGHIVDNQGTLEASSGGILQIDDVVQNSGSGSALIAGGILGFAAKADVDVTFETSAYGVLMLSDAAQFTGKIFGFSGTAANTGSSDAVDLVGFDEADTSFTSHVHNGITTVTVADSSGDDLSAVLNFSGTGFTFQLGASGDGTYLFDPPSAGLSANATAEGTLSFANNDAASDLNASVTPEGSGYAGNLTLDSVGDSNGTASVDYGFSLGNDQINVAAGQTVTQSYEVNLTDAQNPTANASSGRSGVDRGRR